MACTTYIHEQILHPVSKRSRKEQRHSGRCGGGGEGDEAAPSSVLLPPPLPYHLPLFPIRSFPAHAPFLQFIQQPDTPLSTGQDLPSNLIAIVFRCESSGLLPLSCWEQIVGHSNRETLRRGIGRDASYGSKEVGIHA